MKPYRLTQNAEADLEAIWSYIARDGGVDAADRVIDSILDDCAMLGSMPGAGRAREEFGSGIRSFPVGMYIVYYQRPRADRTRIVRVIHGARDQRRVFSGKRKRV